MMLVGGQFGSDAVILQPGSAHSVVPLKVDPLICSSDIVSCALAGLADGPVANLNIAPATPNDAIVMAPDVAVISAQPAQNPFIRVMLTALSPPMFSIMMTKSASMRTLLFPIRHLFNTQPLVSAMMSPGRTSQGTRRKSTATAIAGLAQTVLDGLVSNLEAKRCPGHSIA